MTGGDSIDTKPNGWTGQYFKSVQAGNPLMASIQGAPWQVRGTDPASNMDTLDFFANGMQASPSTPGGTSTGDPAKPWWYYLAPWYWSNGGVPADQQDAGRNLLLGGTGLLIGAILLVIGLLFFLKD